MHAKAALRIVVLVAAIAAVLSPAPASAQQDVITVATVSGSGTVDVPIYIRDVSGTPLGLDQPPGSRIQSYVIKVDYAPTTPTATIARAGITASLTPSFESTPSSVGSVSLLNTFQESTNLIPFTLNGAAPGNQVAHMLVTIPGSIIPGTIIPLTLDPVVVQLTDESGSAATKETVANGRLTLVNGSITVTAAPVELQRFEVD
jgi:hypothetical protein